MKFLILTQYFPPEIGGAPTRLYSLATELIRLGHEVEVVTALPNYPRGVFFPGYEGCLYRREAEAGMVIHRVWMHPNSRGGAIQRMLGYGSFAVAALYGLQRAKRPDYIFVESPPLFVGLPGFLAGRIWKAPVVFNVADLWPDALLELGLLQEGWVARALTALEHWCYRKAAYVNSMTEGIHTALLREKSLSPRKVLFLPHGVDTVRFQPRPPDAELAGRLGLQGKKVVLWAGTLGHAHGLQFVLQAAKLLENQPEIHFLFVGDGTERKPLEAQKQELGLRNVTFHDPVRIDELPPFFSISMCGLASLRDIPAFEGARPSKVFPVLASGKPLLFAGKGETPRLLAVSNAGVAVPPENPEGLAQAIRDLAANPELAEELGKNGRRYVETHLQWSKLIEEWIAKLGPSAPSKILDPVMTGT
jgi:glycosyltransferase involved in cell wall biosynthesis